MNSVYELAGSMENEEFRRALPKGRPRSQSFSLMMNIEISIMHLSGAEETIEGEIPVVQHPLVSRVLRECCYHSGLAKIVLFERFSEASPSR